VAFIFPWGRSVPSNRLWLEATPLRSAPVTLTGDVGAAAHIVGMKLMTPTAPKPNPPWSAGVPVFEVAPELQMDAPSVGHRHDPYRRAYFTASSSAAAEHAEAATGLSVGVATTMALRNALNAHAEVAMNHREPSEQRSTFLGRRDGFVFAAAHTAHTDVMLARAAGAQLMFAVGDGTTNLGVLAAIAEGTLCRDRHGHWVHRPGRRCRQDSPVACA